MSYPFIFFASPSYSPTPLVHLLHPQKRGYLMLHPGIPLHLSSEYTKFLELNDIATEVYDKSQFVPRFIRLNPRNPADLDLLETELQSNLSTVLEKWYKYTEALAQGAVSKGLADTPSPPFHWSSPLLRTTPIPGFYMMPSCVSLASTTAFKNSQVYGLDIASALCVLSLGVARAGPIPYPSAQTAPISTINASLTTTSSSTTRTPSLPPSCSNISPLHANADGIQTQPNTLSTPTQIFTPLPNPPLTPLNTDLQASILHHDTHIHSETSPAPLQYVRAPQVLDICCAPGAKTALAADILRHGFGHTQQNSRSSRDSGNSKLPDSWAISWSSTCGTVTGVDISLHRMYTCKRVLEKYDVYNTRLFQADACVFRVPAPLAIWPQYNEQCNIHHTDNTHVTHSMYASPGASIAPHHPVTSTSGSGSGSLPFLPALFPPPWVTGTWAQLSTTTSSNTSTPTPSLAAIPPLAATVTAASPSTSPHIHNQSNTHTTSSTRTTTAPTLPVSKRPRTADDSVMCLPRVQHLPHQRPQQTQHQHNADDVVSGAGPRAAMTDYKIAGTEVVDGGAVTKVNSEHVDSSSGNRSGGGGEVNMDDDPDNIIASLLNITHLDLKQPQLPRTTSTAILRHPYLEYIAKNTKYLRNCSKSENKAWKGFFSRAKKGVGALYLMGKAMAHAAGEDIQEFGASVRKLDTISGKCNNFPEDVDLKLFSDEYDAVMVASDRRSPISLTFPRLQSSRTLSRSRSGSSDLRSSTGGVIRARGNGVDDGNEGVDEGDASNSGAGSTWRGYDYVMVDAECTHDGSIKHLEKHSKKNWEDIDVVCNNARVNSLPLLQRRLLASGWLSVNAGGILVYSTCSFSRRQNEDVCAWLVAEAGAIVLDAVEEIEQYVREAEVETRKAQEMDQKEQKESGKEVGKHADLLIPVPFPDGKLAFKRGVKAPVIDWCDGQEKERWEKAYSEVNTKCIRFDPDVGTSGLFVCKFMKTRE